MTNRRIIFTNFFSLSGLQVANFLLPLVTLPYIVRVIGPEYFGLVNFAQAFVVYFALVVNYGFDYSATREIAIKRGKNDEIAGIVSAVLTAKFLLLAVSTVVYGLLVFSIPRFQDDLLLYVYTYLLVVGAAVFPTWLFQGMEKLTRTAIFNFIIKAAFTASIFIFIRQEGHYLYIPLINGVGHTVVGVIALFYGLRYFRIRISLPSKDTLLAALKKGWTLFTSTVVINLYTTSNVFILGLLTANIHVGYFTAASKIIIVIQGLLLMPMNQTLFPHIGNALHRSFENGIEKLKRLTFLVGGITFLASVFVFVAAKPIVFIIFGSEFGDAVVALRMMAFLPFIIGLSNVFAIQGLLNLKMDKVFLMITGSGAVLSIALNLILVPRFYELGTSVSWLSTEIFITIASFYVLFRKGINLFDLKVLRSMVAGMKL